MAVSSSSSSSHIKRYHVFPSFHGPDVRRGFLSHLHYHFASKGITTFKDQEIERGNSIGPELVQAIRESRVSIVLLSKNYASSSWCLDELVEIMKCKEDSGQIVMTIFYNVNPSDVRKQKGDFGSVVEKTCQGKTEQVKQRWSKALTDVANIEGEHSLNWANEAEMIQKIATDVSNKLNITPSRDFDGMVGLEAHLTKLHSLLRLESDKVKIIGIWGPAGIGKTTIARALYNKLSTDRKIEDILRVGYNWLLIKDQSLFRHVACFFNNKNVDHVTTLLADSNLAVGNGLKTLTDKCLVHISTGGRIVMHYLLQQLGRQIVLEQSDKPGKRQFLVEIEDIRDVLENETGTGSVTGISFDMSMIAKLSISKRAFEGMRNLRFLRIYRKMFSEKVTVRISEDMKYLPRLRLLYWDSYPRKSLPPTFQPECLVELQMPDSKLEKLWGGIQPLTSLKKIDLGYSKKLIEIPNLLNATNLDTLTLSYCTSLEEVPSSISNLHKLKKLMMTGCEKLQVVPTNINLASLEEVDMYRCSRLRKFPDISSNIKSLRIGNTKIDQVPSSVVGRWSRLERLLLGGISLKRIAHVPESVRKLDLRNCDIKRIPDWVIGLPHLETLSVENCLKLVSIPGFSPSLKTLNANNCVSLKRVCCSFHNPIRKLTFYNCLELDEEARKGIIQQSGYRYICLPGKQVPEEFTHKARGSSVTIPLEETFSASSRFKACLVLSPIKGFPILDITCILRSKGGVEINSFHELAWLSTDLSTQSLSGHLVILSGDFFHQQNRCHEVDGTMSEVRFEFTYWDNEDTIIECGVQILTEKAESSSNREVDYYETEGNDDHHSDGAVYRRNRTSMILGIVIVLCIFVIIQILREIRISDTRCC